MRVSHEIHPHDPLEQDRFAHGLTYEDIGGCGCDICTRARRLRTARVSGPTWPGDREKIERITPAQQQALLRSMQDELHPVQPKPLTCVLAPLDEPEPVRRFGRRMARHASECFFWMLIGAAAGLLLAGVMG